MTPVIFVFSAIVLLVFVSGAYVFVVGCVRRKEIPWLVEKEIKKTPYGKYSEHIKLADQWLKAHNAQDIWLTGNDSLRLHAYWIPAENPKGTVLLAHGYRSTPLLDFGLAFPYYHSIGLNLLVPDQRSHGKSEGTYITFGVLESQDMCSWIEYHNRNFGSVPMLLCGLSMGATTVLNLADRSLPDNVKGIIADCGFTAPHAILTSVFWDVTHLPALPSLLAAELIARLFAGFSLWDCDTRKSLAASRLPVLMIHGKDDGFVPCEMSRQAYDACISDKQLMIVEGADHGVSFLIQPEEYKKTVFDFIGKYLV